MGVQGGSLEPPGPLPMHLHTVHMEYSQCLRTLLNPLAERTCFFQVRVIPPHELLQHGEGEVPAWVTQGALGDAPPPELDWLAQQPTSAGRGSSDGAQRCGGSEPDPI
jgi:hypothetical protein